MLAIDPEAALIAQHLHRKTGRRASEMYPYIEKMLEKGCTRDEILTTFGGLCEVAPELSIAETLEIGGLGEK